jgi:thioredoxin reductase
MPMFDAIIVGAGPAGLSAALILGRCRRKVLVCDTGGPRNAASRGLHGFLTRDGIEPAEFLRIGREQLRPYPSVEFRDVEVTDAESVNDRFEIALGDGSRFSSRKLLLATGVVDNIPEIEGIEPLYGRSVFHCPYCDGWEMRDQPLAVYGKGERGYGLAFKLITWSNDLVLCTDGPAELGSEALEHLSRHGIRLREERIARVEGRGGVLERIAFRSGPPLERRALFFGTGQRQRCELPARFGCEFSDKGSVETGKHEMTNIPGLYVAGDASHAVQLAIIAAAEGAEAAFAINTALAEEDLERGSPF